MALHDLIGRMSMARAELGANDAFILDREDFYIVESGHVDLFTVLVDDRRNALTRTPFVARISAGNAFFGASITPYVDDGDRALFACQAVPARETVLLRGDREHFASPEAFDLDAVALIDDWVVAAAEFVARYEPPPPRDVLLLEADPDVRYAAGAAVSAHHREVLWVSVDRPGLFMGSPRFPVQKDTHLPLVEHTWLTLPEETRVSAVHSPSAILTGRLWPALDWYHVQLLRCARHYRAQRREESLSRLSRNQDHTIQLRGAMLRELTSPMNDTPAGSEPAGGNRSPLHAAAATVAAAAGVTLVDAPAAADGDPLVAVSAVVAPSGIRTRQIRLSPGWERRDGPSFLGVIPGNEKQPVAVVNSGSGAYRMVDPVSGEAAPGEPAASRIDRRARGDVLRTACPRRGQRPGGGATHAARPGPGHHAGGGDGEPGCAHRPADPDRDRKVAGRDHPPGGCLDVDRRADGPCPRCVRHRRRLGRRRAQHAADRGADRRGVAGRSVEQAARVAAVLLQALSRRRPGRSRQRREPHPPDADRSDRSCPGERRVLDLQLWAPVLLQLGACAVDGGGAGAAGGRVVVVHHAPDPPSTRRVHGARGDRRPGLSDDRRTRQTAPGPCRDPCPHALVGAIRQAEARTSGRTQVGGRPAHLQRAVRSTLPARAAGVDLVLAARRRQRGDRRHGRRCRDHVRSRRFPFVPCRVRAVHGEHGRADRHLDDGSGGASPVRTRHADHRGTTGKRRARNGAAGPVGANRIRARELPLSFRGTRCAQGRVILHPAGRVRRLRGPVRSRQVDAVSPAARLRETERRKRAARRTRHSVARSCRHAPPDGRGAAERPARPGQYLQEHCRRSGSHPQGGLGGGDRRRNRR